MNGPRPVSEQVEWLEGDTPLSARFGESYYSTGGGLEESRHVFLQGNGLPARFKPGFLIAELGFGTGLNMLAALECWRDSKTAGALRYYGFERYPLSAESISRALENFPSVHAIAAPFLNAWSSGATSFAAPGIEAEIVLGDARQTLPPWQGRADAWFLDGFSPGRNPELWETELLSRLAEKTRAGGTFATYSAAGKVRRGLAAAGFEVRRERGFGRKRHMLAGRRASV
ncbi:MAG: tRNA (5-methylaminomethyl-2-thiouridine)(34)-methyltransferase MnmD [Albidovulum sp.]|nr:tRNA (5-methylaminomethyl-2-thiouridine)(34)-methyltransferase MnmD [Albidovulum sp.]